MRLTRLVAPTEQPVTVDEVKPFLRVDSPDENLLIQQLIDAAVSHLDGWRGILGRCLVTQTWKAEIDGLGERIALPFPDITVQSATFTDALPGVLEWSWHEALASPALIPVGGWGRPAAVTFTAGFGPASAVPADIKMAIMAMVADWYENRIPGAIPEAAVALIAPYRWRRV